jgi:PAS domain S-box-containing protein
MSPLPTFALSPKEKPRDYIASHWDTETGLPHNAIKALLQSRDGYLWVGTQQGIARFDGVNFTVFNPHNTPTLLNSQITSIAETPDGSLWFGTSNGLARYFNGRFVTYTAKDGVRTSTGTVNAVCVANDGSLWIGANGGLTRWVNGRFVAGLDLGGIDTSGMRRITATSDGAIWLAVGNDAVRCVDGKVTRYSIAEGLTAHPMQALTENNGQILAITQRGMFTFIAAENRFVPYERNNALSSLRLDSAAVDRAGNLWVGSVGGLDRVTADSITPYSDPYGSRPGVVDVILEDRENCLWLGTSIGLYRLTDRRGYSLSTEDHITGTLVTAVTQTKDNALWVASWGGGVERFANGTFQHFAAGAPLSYDSVTCLYQDPSGAMWLGTRNSSVDRIEGDRVSTFVYKPGVATSRPVTALQTSPEGALLIGISKRGLLELRKDQIQPVPEAAFLGSETIWTLALLRDGRFLAGTTAGLFQRQPDRTWKPVNIPGVTGPIIVRAVLEDADETVWLATDGHGLVRWQKTGGRVYNAKSGLPDDTFFSVLDDGAGALWISSARGILKIRRTDFDNLDRGVIRRLNPLTFGRTEGLLSGSTSGFGSPSAVRTSEGRLLTATDVGVAVIDPRAIQANDRAPNVVVERVIADDRALPPGDQLIVPAGTNRLELRYTALSLVAPQRLRFRYRLHGSDQSWIEAGSQRTATYTHLRPGNYRFQVLACNNDGVWNETGASVAITFEPRLYETTAFRLSVGLGAVLAAIGLFRWRLHRLRRKERELAEANAILDRRVRERTAELSLSNEELQRRESLFRLIFEHAPIGISWHRRDLGPEHHFNSAFQEILGLAARMVSGFQIGAYIHPDDAPRHAECAARISSGAEDSSSLELRFVRSTGATVHGLFATAVVRDGTGAIVQEISILEDITARKIAEQELERTYKRLMEVSRQNGMAEVATGVLHNVGNVLNSVNVSVAMLDEALRQSRITGLTRVTRMLQDAENLGAFFTSDPRSQHVLPYLQAVAEHLTSDQQNLVAEVHSLATHIDHIKEIVTQQQSLAVRGGVLEKVTPSEMFEQALEMTISSLNRHSVTIVREFGTSPELTTERHKVLQILINLIQNAKDAVTKGRAHDRRITLRVAADAHFVRFTVSDNGIGIAPENLTRIFEHGFTTRPNGHGFGLHSSANDAHQLNGSLLVRSPGVGQGATFILELPIG